MAAKTNAKSQFQRRREISEMERIEKQRDYLVVKANALANTYPYEMSKSEGGPLSEQQNKVISYLISQIRPEDTAIPTFTFDMKRFALVCGIDPSGGSYYNNLKKSIKSLMNKTVELRSTDGPPPLHHAGGLRQGLQDLHDTDGPHADRLPDRSKEQFLLLPVQADRDAQVEILDPHLRASEEPQLQIYRPDRGDRRPEGAAGLQILQYLQFLYGCSG